MCRMLIDRVTDLNITVIDAGTSIIASSLDRWLFLTVFPLRPGMLGPDNFLTFPTSFLP